MYSPAEKYDYSMTFPLDGWVFSPDTGDDWDLLYNSLDPFYVEVVAILSSALPEGMGEENADAVFDALLQDTLRPKAVERYISNFYGMSPYPVAGHAGR